MKIHGGLAILGIAASTSACGGGSSATATTSDGGTPDATVDAAPEAQAEAATFAVERLNAAVDKIDLVLAVDNSASMADKQFVLSLAVPDLLHGLLDPPCIDDATTVAVAAGQQPADPLAACPAGSHREFPAIRDVHVGLLSSSLGSFGADGCPEHAPASCTGATPNSISNDDHGHLVTRVSPCGTTDVPTYQSKGFVAWDPAMKLNPPGTSTISDLTTTVTNLVVGDGQLGCGFESQDESWYRFLVDPTPYQSISLPNNQVQISGIDQALLDQRKAFLRPDSLLAVVVVSDETDTSIKEYSAYPLFAAPEVHLPHPTAACGFGTASPAPTNACCSPCGASPPTGCSADPACGGGSSVYTDADESTAIRAFGLIGHKSRYGVEVFYPPSRYVDALTQATVMDATGKAVPNPIYTNLDPASYAGSVRDPDRVVYAAVVGVPWQLLARQTAAGAPDLVSGISAVDPTQVGGFKSAAELALADAHGHTYWDDIAGDPEHYVDPKSPFMQESSVPRSGVDPVTGAAIAPPSTANGSGSLAGGALLNDHERTIRTPAGDIEYACVFDLPAGHTRDCTAGGVCDCPSSAGTTTDNPLCTGTTQVKAKAYPGIKELAIAKGMGTHGVAGSICPKQLTDAAQPDYGYRPSVRAIVDAIKPVLDKPCLSRTLAPNGDGQVQCIVVEARATSGACTCDAGQTRAPVSAADMPAVTAIEAQNAGDPWNCFCEVPQLTGPGLTNCQTDANATSNGWCYVDATMGAAQQAVVSQCPGAPSAQREIRLVGAGAPLSGAAVFLACSGP